MTAGLTAGPVARPAAGPLREDGRAARSRRTRTAVIDALLALQEEGHLQPTALQVAGRAGVALRTVFGHFSDMETLWVEAGRRELEVLVELADVIPPDAPLAERLQRFAASRARVLDKLLPVLRATRLREPSSPALTANRAVFVRAGDDEVEQVFASELALCDAAARRWLLDAVYVAAGAPTWELLRLDRGMSPGDARRCVERLLTVVLAPRPAAAPEVL